ncbi:hypothetical protein LTR37_021015 [Vermiconidia calcicola]|uniref:Uncharacterized protein n=1 Tax=Vermiconidia calcicola TaxID=1690605 RepID=A0ACC3M9U7_9PEZI|nr:hypothetical protein LTR37_021015 [Vermiconidia calcicola]
MSRATQQVPEALVLRWNSQTLRARCPYCLYSHRHGLPRATSASQRSSDCADVGLSGEYRLVFPGGGSSTAAGYGWEVNREASAFITVDSQGAVAVPINYFQSDRTLLPQYREQHKPKPALDDADSETGELVTASYGSRPQNNCRDSEDNRQGTTTDDILDLLYSDPDYRRSVYFSHCASRDIQGLESLFSRWPSDQFLGAVTKEGDTGVLLTAHEENGLQTLRWLEDKGDSVHLANHYGRTALMEASLWGRLNTVQYLTQRNVHLEARDSNGMRAVDLAADTERNTTERPRRAGIVYREPAYASKQRRMIEALLKRFTAPSLERADALTAPQRRAFFGRNSDGKLEVFRPQELLEPPRGPYKNQKAFATLDRGSTYPFINAMSGYSYPDWPNVLDNRVWTEKAEGLRALLGLPVDKIAASHVEPQLLAYLLDRHSLQRLVVVDDDKENVDEVDLAELATVLPAYTLRPIITVSKPDLCRLCFETFQRFKTRFPASSVVFHCVGDTVAAPLRVRA